MKGKYEVGEQLIYLINCLENITESKVQFVKSDGGTEYKGSYVQNYFKSKGIKHLNKDAIFPGNQMERPKD